MTVNTLLFITITHFCLGVILPSILNIFDDRIINISKYKNTILGWKFMWWGIFFSSMVAFLTINFIINYNSGWIVALLLGVLPLSILAFIAYWQSLKKFIIKKPN
jgi:hypothetical protein